MRHLKLLNARNPESYLVNLRDNLSYQEARKKLITEISGAGQKVSDCICLMSLKKHEAIPVDTHIFQVAIEHYNFNSSGNKSGKAALSFAQYNQIAKFFQDLHGKYAGWAQSVLFSSHIKKLA